MCARASSGSHLEVEITEQPAALRRLLASESEPIRRLARGLRDRGDITSVTLAGRGSSDNAGRYAQYVFGVFNALPVALAAPSLFSRYRRPPQMDGSLVIAVSQSGRSPDVVGVLAEANAQGRPTVAVTNDVGSALATEARAVIGLHAGEERSVAATKTYVTSLAALALLSVELADEGEARRADLDRAAEWLEGVVAATADELAVPEWLAAASSCAVIGRGFNYGTAYEIALKMKELTGVVAQPYSSADFLHGPIGAVGEGYPVLLVAHSGAVLEDMADLVAPLRERGARLVVISDDPDLLGEADLALPVPEGIPEWVSPLVDVAPGQVLAWRLAERLGRDLDRPHGLRKVTETH